MKNTILTLILLFLFIKLNAQVNQVWTTTDVSLGSCTKLGIDPGNKIYVVGGQVIGKYNGTTGVQEWEQNVGYEIVSHIIDPFGNSFLLVQTSTQTEIIKLDVNGTIVWQSNACAPNAVDMTIDNSGNIFTVGSGPIWNGNQFVQVVHVRKTNPDGSLNSFDYFSGTYPKDIICDENGDLYVLCSKLINGNTSDNVRVVSYEFGFLLGYQWITDLDYGLGSGVDYGNKLLLDGQGHLYVWGTYHSEGGIAYPFREGVHQLDRETGVNNLIHFSNNGEFYDDVIIDNAGNFYISSFWGYIRKYMFDFNIEWTVNDHRSIKLGIDVSGNIYGNSTNSPGIFEINNSGILAFENNLPLTAHPYLGYSYSGYSAQDILVDYNQNSFLLFQCSNGMQLSKFSKCSNIVSLGSASLSTVTPCILDQWGYCSGGKIKVNFSGTYAYYQHLSIYNSNNLLTIEKDTINSSSITLGGIYGAAGIFSPGKYSVIAYDQQCPIDTFIAIVKCPAPQNINSIIQGNSATLNWDGNNSCNNGYRIQYRIQGTTAWTTISSSMNSISKTIFNLNGNTTYEYRIATKCDGIVPVTSSNYSSILTFETSYAIVPPPTTAVLNITQTTATINWSSVNAAYAYNIRVRKQGTTTWTNKTVLAPGTSKIFTGLTANQTYEYQVRTVFDVSGLPKSAYTAIQTFVTPLRLETETTNEFEISVIPNPCNNCELIGNLNEEDIVITDLLGRRISASLEKSSRGYFIQIENNSTGIYIVRNLKTGEAVRFVKE